MQEPQSVAEAVQMISHGRITPGIGLVIVLAVLAFFYRAEIRAWLVKRLADEPAAPPVAPPADPIERAIKDSVSRLEAAGAPPDEARRIVKARLDGAVPAAPPKA